MTVTHRSVSQFSQYYQCPHSYYLSRIATDAEGNRIWQKPAAWLVQGTAFHDTADEWERSDRSMTIAEAVDHFRAAYTAAAAELLEDTPRMDFWFASGPYRGAADLERRMLLGGTQVAEFVSYHEARPEEKVWTDDSGERVIEKKYRIDLEGVTVEGYIDVVREDSQGRVKPVDYKTGNKFPEPMLDPEDPGDPVRSIQLPTYKVMIEMTNDVVVDEGSYYMAKHKKPVHTFPLTEWNKDRLTEVYHKLDDDINAGNFPAIPESSKCMFCSVRAACSFAA